MNKIITSAFVFSLAIMLPSCHNAQLNDQTNPTDHPNQITKTVTTNPTDHPNPITKTVATNNYVIPEPAGIVEGNGKVVPISGIRYLSSELSGTVSAIHVKSNQQVS